MDQLIAISAVSKSLGVSSRTLRYYEKIGLVQSRRLDDYAYRVYDDDAIRRLRQIIILRKLHVPVKQIREIFDNHDAAGVIDVFERNISELDERITALATVKSILNRLVAELREKANLHLQIDYLGDNAVFAAVGSISLPQNTIQEEVGMNELNKANEALDLFKEVRYVHLAPARAAAYSVVSNNPEDEAIAPIYQWVQDNDLAGTARFYLFNTAPYEWDTTDGTYGMGCCVTIPEGVEIPADFTEMRLPGGDYAVSEWKDNDSGWSLLGKLKDAGDWQWERDFDRHPFPGLEEHIKKPDSGWIINIMMAVKKNTRG